MDVMDPNEMNQRLMSKPGPRSSSKLKSKSLAVSANREKLNVMVGGSNEFSSWYLRERVRILHPSSPLLSL